MDALELETTYWDELRWARKRGCVAKVRSPRVLVILGQFLGLSWYLEAKQYEVYPLAVLLSARPLGSTTETNLA